MKKWIVLFCILIFTLSLAACSEIAVLDEIKVYQIGSDIHSLNIRINAADFVIKQADAFSVESNLKYLAVSEENGVLNICEEAKVGVTYTNAVLTLCVPEGTVFEAVSITTGAARLTAQPLSTKSLELELGAGDVKFDGLYVSSKAHIEGGAGRITVANGTITELDLEMGTGELNLTAALCGSCDLTLGVGTTNLTLIGSKDDYKVDIEKGVGSITVDGESVSEFDSEGNGPSDVEIEGGVGAINLRFQEAEIK